MLQQPVVSEIIHHIEVAAKCIQDVQRDITIIKGLVGLNKN